MSLTLSLMNPCPGLILLSASSVFEYLGFLPEVVFLVKKKESYIGNIYKE